MGEFRNEFKKTFGCDFPRSGIDLSLPRLRFELAVGEGDARLQVALERCRAIFDRVFRGIASVWLELRYWEDPGCEGEIRTLESLGLLPLEGTGWQREDVVLPEDEDSMTEHRFSVRIPVDSPGLDHLFLAVVRFDFGRYRELTPTVLLVDLDRALGFYPYDDRGADLFSPDVGVLRPICRELDDWILDYDRERIRRESGLPSTE